MNQIVTSIVDPATLRIIELDVDEITLRFVDGGVVHISVDNDGLLVLDNEPLL